MCRYYFIISIINVKGGICNRLRNFWCIIYSCFYYFSAVVTLFNKRESSKDGFRSQCKGRRAEMKKEHCESNKEIILTKRCIFQFFFISIRHYQGKARQHNWPKILHLFLVIYRYRRQGKKLVLGL